MGFHIDFTVTNNGMTFISSRILIKVKVAISTYDKKYNIFKKFWLSLDQNSFNLTLLIQYNSNGITF
jgi:hypothetical protein